jgi:pyruvate/2-oxoglutarate/acetoin dehydrogenase E1 component
MGLAVSGTRAEASNALGAEKLIEIYRLMVLSRRVDDREIMLKRQQKIYFQISCAGHEALQVGAGLALRPGCDWFFPYYRDRALCLALGVSPDDMMLQAVGAATDPASGGRQMPTHWGSRELNIVSTSSSTATQVLHAVGCAEAGRYFSRHPEAAAKHEGDYRAFRDVKFQGDEVALTCLGEGSTSQGEFWEALNTASNQKLPIIICVEDNGYAISVPVEVNTPGGNISRLVANFPNFHFEEVDGTDAEASYFAFQRAAEHCRAGLGPAFVHGHCMRAYSHSLSDDDKWYRSAAEREADALRDPRIVVFGEDVADASRAEALDEVKGKGGVFKLTAGLQREFGSERVFNSPLAEANILGRSIGYAVRGMKPVVEVQFFDYIWPAMHQIRNELAVMRWRSNGSWASPMVLRVPIGGYLTGGSIYHSQSGESIFTHIPGLRVVMPSNALDANGLLRTAIRSDDPVLFLEHKRLYREPFGKAPDPGPEYTIPFGKAKIVRPGAQMTLVTYGAVVPRALQAAERALREHDIDVEVIDLRTLSPYDWETIATSVRKTSRVIVAHEDMQSWGYGAEIAARIADELFEELDAPVRRVAGMDTFVAYQPLLEDEILPQPEKILKAIVSLKAF